MKNKPCRACQSLGRDKTGDHLFLMKGGDQWACGRNGMIHAPYFEDMDGNPVTPGQSSQRFGSTTQTLATIQSSAPAFTQPQPATLSLSEVEGLGDSEIRNISRDVVKFYQVKIEFDQTSGDPLTHYYPISSHKKIVSYHVRTLPKSFWHLHTVNQLPDHLDLFGMLTVDKIPDHVILTEGEIDAMAAFEMLVFNKRVLKLRVLSLPTGNNLKHVIANKKFLDRVPDLYFCPDQDDAGLKLIPEISRHFPLIKIMKFSEKDPDDMLSAGKVEEFYTAFQQAKRYVPESILSSNKLKAAAMLPVTVGLSYPFKSLTDMTYGLTTKRLIGIGAGPGTGKTVVAQTLIKHILFQHQEKVGVFSLEEMPSDSLKRMAGHVMQRQIHLPNQPYDPKELSKVLDSFDGLLYYYDSAEYRGDWEQIEESIRHMAIEGVKYFFIDPLSALHTHLSASDSNQYLSTAMFSMAQLIKELDISIFHINHLNNPMGSKDHGEGARVKASQFTGSRAQWRFSTDVWGLERDAQNPDMQLRHMTTFRVIKNRLSGQLGTFQIKFDHNTGVLVEPPLSKNF